MLSKLEFSIASYECSVETISDECMWWSWQNEFLLLLSSIIGFNGAQNEIIKVLDVGWDAPELATYYTSCKYIIGTNAIGWPFKKAVSNVHTIFAFYSCSVCMYTSTVQVRNWFSVVHIL